MDGVPPPRELEQAVKIWIKMKSAADHQASLERKKYGHSSTTSASVVDTETPLVGDDQPARHTPRSHGNTSTSSRDADDSLPTRVGEDTDVEMDDDYVDIDEGASLQQMGGNKYTRVVARARARVASLYRRNRTRIHRFLLVGLFLLYCAYFGWALSYDPRKATALIVITCLTILMTFYGFVRDYYGDCIMERCWPPVERWFSLYWKYLRWVLLALLLGLFTLFLVLEVAKNPIQLRSLAGMILILAVVYAGSVDQSKVRWRPVFWGVGIQLLMGLIVLRWKPGYSAFYWLASKVQALLNYADYGAKFMFGDPEYLMHPMAFKVIPMVVFFSAFTNMMFYLGVMQVIIGKVAWVMQGTMQTTAIETLSVAGNIFFTLAEESFILRPYIMKLTRSELHAVMTGGSATAAGFALAMYIELGAPAIHVFSAAVMSAPAALAIAKLSYPELEESTTCTEKDVHIESGEDSNILEAAARGATSSIKVISYAVAILIAFFGLLALLNDFLSWVGSMVGHPDLSFELICSYIVFPVTYMAGIEAEDAGKVGSMLGVKYFGSDLIAYTRMGELRQLGRIQDRSVMIGTYALLGFSSLSSIGVNIGILGALAPQRRNDVASLAIRAIINGNLASLLTACLAGFLNDS